MVDLETGLRGRCAIFELDCVVLGQNKLSKGEDGEREGG